MSDIPMQMPVDNAQPSPVQDVSEYGGQAIGRDHGAAVNAFNDLSSTRSGSDEMHGFNDFQNGQDGGPESRDFYSDDLEDFHANNDSIESDDTNQPDNFDENQETSENLPGGFEEDERLSNGEDFDEIPDSEPYATGDNESELGGKDHQGAEQPEQDENLPESKDHSTIKDNGQNVEKVDDHNVASSRDDGSQVGKKEEPKSVEGQKIISRMAYFERIARGIGTKEDWKRYKAEIRKQQYSGSAVPKGPWLPKGGGGSAHAQPKQSGPSKLAQYQREAKARAAKWDEVQSWNDKAVQRAQSQHDAIWNRLKKLS